MMAKMVDIDLIAKEVGARVEAGVKDCLEARGFQPGDTVTVPEISVSLDDEALCATAGHQHLRVILDEAYNQAAYGKGRERHAGGLPFDRQPIMAITRDEGLGFPIGQARKKSSEAHRMAKRGEYDRAEADLLGAIVYLAAAVLAIREASRQAAADDWENIGAEGTD